MTSNQRKQLMIKRFRYQKSRTLLAQANLLIDS
jgi:hypothetical protein